MAYIWDLICGGVADSVVLLTGSTTLHVVGAGRLEIFSKIAFPGIMCLYAYVVYIYI